MGISSSPRRNGSTAYLVDEALAEAKRYNAIVEHIHLPSYNMKFCKGCMNCLRNGKCAISDGFEKIKSKIMECDGIIIGSPTYGLAPNAIMKNFLDRFGIYSVYRSALGGKYIVGISTAGAIGSKKVAKKLTGLVSGAFAYGYVSGTFGFNVKHGKAQDHPEAASKARKLGKRIVEDISLGRKYRLQRLGNKLLHKIIIKPIMLKNIMEHKDLEMKSVYLYLRDAGYIS
ncbi:MAG: flavodoxin family protein [Thermoplasmata archaeon]|nr:MAG: flavodoxin family protein [Thermoplasmata archaeon]